MNDTESPTPSDRKPFALSIATFFEHPILPVMVLVLIGLIFRVALILGADGLMWADSNTYYHGAHRILENGIFTPQSIYRTPLYPLFLSVFLRFGETPVMGKLAIIAQHILGLASVLFFYACIRRVFGAAAAFLTALLLSAHTLLLYYELVVQTEVLFVFMLSLTTWCFLRALDSNRLWQWAIFGMTLGLLTLTRPTGQLLLLALFPVIWWKTRSLRRTLLVSVLTAAVFIGTMTPWMLANLRHYGFFGVVHIQGTQLYHKVFDKAHLPTPATTRHGEAHEMTRELLSVERSSRSRIDWTAFVLMQDRYGFTPLRADQELFGYAVETVMANFTSFAHDTFHDFILFYWNAKPSPTIKNNEEGPYFASKHGKRFAMPAFPSEPVIRFPGVRQGLAIYFRHVDLPIKPLIILWLIGTALFFLFNKSNRPEALAFLIIPLYLGALTVPFDTYQDRYRLPADPYLFAFAMFALVYAARLLLKRRQPSPPTEQHEITP